MDGREAMASYHLYRGLGGAQHQQQPGLLGIRPISGPSANPNPSLQVQQSSSIGGGGGVGGGGGSIGSAFQVESPPSISHHGANVGVGAGGAVPGAVGQVEPVKRKRGRPRKYGPDGSVSLALSPISSSSTPGSGQAAGSGVASGTPGKRGRGRPPGTGRKQLLASLGEWVVGSAGMAFTPHVITISAGEDITAKIMSFSQQGPRAVCILSATGSVSTVTLRQPSTSGGTVTYEGRFEILSLSGSYFMTDDGGSRSRNGGLSVSLSSPDGRVIGGGVGGLLIAATNVQVIVGSFIYGGGKQKSKPATLQESSPDSEHQMINKPSTPPGGIPIQNPAPLMGWPGSRQVDIRNAHIDIDLMRG